MKLEEAKGDWALVTGASSGIGHEFALQLAASGMNLVLVARRQHLLNILGSELSHKYSIKTFVVAVDLSQPTAITELRSRLISEGIKVRLIVNNAALAKWGHFEATPKEIYEDMIRLNVIAPVLLCYNFLQDLTSFPTSVIINVSSPAAFNPIPYMAVYAATKAFIYSFSQALHGEWKDRGLLVQTLLPGPTETDLGTAAGNYAYVLKKGIKPPTLAVKTSLTHLAKGTPVVISARGVYKQRLFSALFPAKLVIKIVKRMFQPS
jgi:short-subunit dehydrogenase